MFLSKSDLRDPLNPPFFLKVQMKIICYRQNIICANWPPYLLKRVSALKKSAILMAKMAQKCQKPRYDIFLDPKTP